MSLRSLFARTLIGAAVSIFFLASSPLVAHAESGSEPPNALVPPTVTSTPLSRTSDYLFPGHLEFSAMLATGVPFVVMSELSVGFSDRFAIGAMAGIALSGSDGPRNTGFGIRPRANLYDWGRDRITVEAPVLYYPISRGSWFLAHPTFRYEHRFGEGAYLKGGAGLMLVALEDSLFGGKSTKGSVMPYGGSPGKSTPDALNGIWNTFDVGGAYPLSRRTHLFLDASIVLRGFKLPGDEWVGAVPFTATLGITTVL